MNRRLKIFGLILIAVLSLGVGVASTASAESASFSLSIEPTIRGEQIGTDTFTIGSNPVTCATATFKGNASGLESESAEVTLTPAFETCHAIVVILGVKVTRTATVTVNGCSYLVDQTKNTGGASFSADLAIECPTGKQIEIHVYNSAAEPHSGSVICTYDIKPQAVNEAAELTNTASHDISAHVAAGLETINTIQNATCGVATESTYEGEDTFTAAIDAETKFGLTVK